MSGEMDAIYEARRGLQALYTTVSEAVASDVQQRVEAAFVAVRDAERKRIQDGLHQMCEESPDGLYGDYGPVMLIGEQVEALVDDKPWEGLEDEEEGDDD